jgi:site-specific DNA-methyltransferase (adenine-specific)
MENRTILQGDVLGKLLEIPDKSIDCIISSPPYWGLRDYDVDGQWGLEPDFRDYLENLRKLMHELKRVLKDTGTCWINLGDTYSGGNAHSDWNNTTIGPPRNPKFDSIKKDHLQSKTRFGIPERFYINCIDDGWIARNHIPWIKSNAMPSSVKDRFTNKWESIFFFAKKQKYYFNLDAVREKPITGNTTKPFNIRS